MSVSSKSYKYENIAAELVRLIKMGTFRPGERIPSVRKLSEQERVSISTVTQAYYMLEAQGWIEAHPQSGFYVCDTLPVALPEPDISEPAPDPTNVSVWDLTMMIINDPFNPNLIQMGAAYPNPELTAMHKLNRILASIARKMEIQNSLYEAVEGNEALRVQIARRAINVGCHLSPNDIRITAGCSEAVSLSLRAICKPGDTVAIESPICFDQLQCLETLGLKALEIPTHPRNGISLQALRFAIQQTPIQAVMVISNFNNPLGSYIPEANKRALVDLLADYEIPLIEINLLGELYFGDQHPKVAKSYDRKGLVLLCSSFSKDLCPAYRIGWIVPGKYKSKVQQLKYASNLATATLPQLAIAEFLSSGSYDVHLRRIRRVYARRIAALTQAVNRYFPEGTRMTRPAGGFVSWIQLSETVDSLVLYKKAKQAGIAITPGYIFSTTDQYRNFIRLNAANWDDNSERAIQHLGELIRRFI
jgi:DNA-binding transcriptional MocR family regulator